MNIVNATVLRNNLADALLEISDKKKYLLIAKRGKINSALINIELLEDFLELTNSKYLESIKKARKEYEKGETFTHDMAFGNI